MKLTMSVSSTKKRVHLGVIGSTFWIYESGDRSGGAAGGTRVPVSEYFNTIKRLCRKLLYMYRYIHVGIPTCYKSAKNVIRSIHVDLVGELGDRSR